MKIKQTVEKVTIKSKVSYFRFIKVVNPRLKKGGKKNAESQGLARVIECLPCIHETLHSVPSIKNQSQERPKITVSKTKSSLHYVFYSHLKRIMKIQ